MNRIIFHSLLRLSTMFTYLHRIIMHFVFMISPLNWWWYVYREDWIFIRHRFWNIEKKCTFFLISKKFLQRYQYLSAKIFCLKIQKNFDLNFSKYINFNLFQNLTATQHIYSDILSYLAHVPIKPSFFLKAQNKR